MHLKNLVVSIVFSIVLINCKAQRSADQRIVSYQRCHYDSDCRENSFCYGNDDTKIGDCKCKDGFELITRNKTYYNCQAPLNWNDPCKEDDECFLNLGPLAKCDTTCKCRDGTHLYTDGLCYASVLLYDNCRTDANCLLKDGTFGYCTAGICDCNLNYRATDDRLGCVMSKNLGDKCDKSEECSAIKDAMCRIVCECTAGYAISHNQKFCLKAATAFGNACTEDDQCSKYLQNSACVNGTCGCSEGQHSYQGKCYKTVKKGEHCASLFECVFNEEMLKSVNCTEDVCQCLNGASNDDDCNSGSNSNHVFLGSSMVISTIIIYFLN